MLDISMPHASKLGTRRTLAANGILLLVLWSLLFSQFSATTHQLAVQHATCLQHGELLDVASSGAAADSALTVKTSQLSASTSGDGQTHHQHCAFVSSRASHKIFRLQLAHSIELPMQGEQACCWLTDVPQVTVTLYLNAPKHSPPAA